LTRLTISASQSTNFPPTSASPPRSGLSYLMQENQSSIDKEDISHPPRPEMSHHSLSTPTTPPPSNPSSVDLKPNYLPRPNSPLPSNSAYSYSSNEMDWKTNANTMPSLMGKFRNNKWCFFFSAKGFKVD
jgi:hypothetical protein